MLICRIRRQTTARYPKIKTFLPSQPLPRRWWAALCALLSSCNLISATLPVTCLVALADEVVGKRLDGRGSVSGDGTVGVVAHDDGLLGLGDGETGAALSRLARLLPSQLLRFKVKSRVRTDRA